MCSICYIKTLHYQAEQHSTDTHGNESGQLLDSACLRIASRRVIANLHKKIDTLVGLHHPNHYADSLIKPSRKAFNALISQEWPNIQRIMASLAQKDVHAGDDRPQVEQLCPPESD